MVWAPVADGTVAVPEEGHLFSAGPPLCRSLKTPGLLLSFNFCWDLEGSDCDPTSHPDRDCCLSLVL